MSIVMSQDIANVLDAKPEKAAAFAACFGCSAEDILESYKAFKAEQAAKATAAAAKQAAAAKAANFAAFSKRVTGYTLPASLVALAEEGKALADSLSDKDGKFVCQLFLERQDNKWVLVAEGEAVATADGRRSRTTYDYFIDGAPIDGRLSTWLMTNQPGSVAAKALVAAKGAGGAPLAPWAAVQMDPVLKPRVTRLERD